MLTKKLLRTYAYTLSISFFMSSGFFSIGATGPHDQTDQREECAVCADELSTGMAIVHLDCGEKVPHRYHLGCLEQLIKAKYTACPICRKPLKLYNPWVKPNDLTRIHGVERDLTKDEQQRLSTLLRKIPVSTRPFPVIEKPVPPAPAPETPKPAPTATKPETAKDKVIQEDLTDGLTPDQRKKFYDMPIANEPFPDIPLTEEDIKLNSELPKHLDPKEWQVIVVLNNQKMREHYRARRAKKLVHWSHNSTEDSSTSFKPLKSLGQKLQGIPGDLAAGFMMGYLIGPEFCSKKSFIDGSRKSKSDKKAFKSHLNFRRMLYLPALAGAYAVDREINPGRKVDSKVGLSWALGLAVGVCLHLLTSK